MTASFASRKAHARAGAASIDAEIEKSLAFIAEQRVAFATQAAASRVSEKDRHRFTRDEILAANYVYTPWWTWERIIRVNKVTVAVLGLDGYGSTVKFDQIRGVHK